MLHGKHEAREMTQNLTDPCRFWASDFIRRLPIPFCGSINGQLTKTGESVLSVQHTRLEERRWTRHPADTGCRPTLRFFPLHGLFYVGHPI